MNDKGFLLNNQGHNSVGRVCLKFKTCNQQFVSLYTETDHSMVQQTFQFFFQFCKCVDKVNEFGKPSRYKNLDFDEDYLNLRSDNLPVSFFCWVRWICSSHNDC